MRKKLSGPENFAPMDLFEKDFPVSVDLVYAKPDHPENIFGAVYRPEARLWLHDDLAGVVLLAARLCAFEHPGVRFQLKDGLRPVEAQAAMLEAEIVKRNPHWLQEPNRLLSPPGAGGHPRGMAVDVALVDESGAPLDMGTAFDHLSEDPDFNPAARDFHALSGEARRNRRILEGAMRKAAVMLARPLLPLPSEWWDFRFPPEIYEEYEPVRDSDLPEEMRMTRERGEEEESPACDALSLQEKKKQSFKKLTPF